MLLLNRRSRRLLTARNISALSTPTATKTGGFPTGNGRFLKRPAITVSFSEIMMPDRSLTPRKAQAELRNHAFAFMEAVSGSKDQICYIRYEYKPKTDTGVPREAEGKEHAV